MMHVGMLWLDDTPRRPLEEKVRRAAAYYRRKYGQQPTLCYVHPAMLPEGRLEVEGVAVRPLKDILPQHLWLGVAEAQEAQRPALQSAGA